MPLATSDSEIYGVVLTRLRESHDLSAYESIERLVQTGEAVGLDAKALIGMLDRGTTLDELLKLIQSRLDCLEEAA